MAKRGYRKCEPALIPAEEPGLFRAILDVHRKDHRRTPAELSELLGMYETSSDKNSGNPRWDYG